MTDVQITENAQAHLKLWARLLKRDIIADNSSADKKDCIEGNMGVSSKDGTGDASPGKSYEDANLAGPDTKVSVRSVKLIEHHNYCKNQGFKD